MSEALPLATPGVDYTTTTHYAFYKPVYNLDVGVWGDHVNANSDQLDALIWNLNQGMLPLAGGTLSGSLAITTGTLIAGGKVGTLFAGLNIAQPQLSYLSSNVYQDTSNVWRSMAGGGVTYIQFNAGTTAFYAAASSTAGNAVTLTQILQMNTLGITMATGTDISLIRNPTNALHAATKQYVDTMLPLAGGSMTGALRLSSGPAVPGDASVATSLYTNEHVTELGGHLSFNAYLATGATWKYRAAGYSGWFYQDNAMGAVVVATQASGAAGAAIGSNTGQWLFRQDGAFLCSGAVFAGNAAVPGSAYLAADSVQTLLNFQANYGLIFRRSDGLVYYAAAGAPSGMAFNCSPAGNFSVGNNFTASGSVQGLNVIGTNAVWPSYSQSTDWYLSGDGSNLHFRWGSGWELYFQRSSGSMFYQRSGTNWFNWRAGDAITYNGIANQGGIGPYADYSDIRGKRDVAEASEGLEAVRLLRPVSFIRIPRAEDLPPPRREIGFVAQDLQQVIPEAVMPFEDLESDNPGLAIMTTPIVAALVNAVKELAARVETLEGRRGRRH